MCVLDVTVLAGLALRQLKSIRSLRPLEVFDAGILLELDPTEHCIVRQEAKACKPMRRHAPQHSAQGKLLAGNSVLLFIFKVKDA